ncbi:hypothetical protein KR054_001681, partial [Drosophila jambulina]
SDMDNDSMEENNSECAAGANDSSPALNVLCAICNEFFRANDTIYSTTQCGHVFHKDCLTRWLSRSLTCPQCRSHCHRSRVHRIYLNFAERTELDDVEPSKMPIQWVPMDLEVGAPAEAYQPPEGAVQCGTDEDGHPTYVSRAYFRDDRLPASYVAEKKAAFGSYSCRAYALTDDVELLVLSDCDHSWVPGRNGSHPEGALQVGYSEIGEVTYTGRALYEGIMRLGKVHPSHRVMYIPHRGQEVNINAYEVLVVTPREQAER